MKLFTLTLLILIILHIVYFCCNKVRTETMKIRFRESDIEEFANLMKEYLNTRSQLVLNQQKNINNAVKLKNSDINNNRTKKELSNLSNEYTIDNNQINNLLDDKDMPLTNDKFSTLKKYLENTIEKDNDSSNILLLSKLTKYKELIDKKYSNLSKYIKENALKTLQDNKKTIESKIKLLNNQLVNLSSAILKTPMGENYEPQTKVEKENIESAKNLLSDSVLSYYVSGKYDLSGQNRVITEAHLKDIYNIREMMTEQNCARACASDNSKSRFGYDCNGFMYNKAKDECKIFENKTLNLNFKLPENYDFVYGLDRDKLKGSQSKNLVIDELKLMIKRNTEILESILEGKDIPSQLTNKEDSKTEAKNIEDVSQVKTEKQVSNPVTTSKIVGIDDLSDI